MDIKEKYLNLKRALFDKCYVYLNKEQRKAVYNTEGPLLVLAGAGSGKTTVLVQRVVFIIKYGDAYYNDYVPEWVDERYIAEMEAALADSGTQAAQDMLSDFAYGACPPYGMLAITFTNKAANEIKARLASALDDSDAANDIWAGTFHSVCMRILRINCEKIGYKKEFTIYDADDTKKAIASAMKRCMIDEKTLPLKSVIAAISRAKEKLVTPDMFEEQASGDYRRSKIARVYREYQKTLEASNAMDFDDIIMKTIELFYKAPDVLAFYQKKFRYVCVDEYQDTNDAQFVLTSLISRGSGNIMVVGDDDQSIYKFRGATIENILNFDKNFDNTRVIKLEQNYRSTQTILDAANAVISHNTGRHGKTLWTAGKAGNKIIIRHVEDQNLEAKNIVDTVYRAVAHEGRTYKDFAILYRNNAQSSSIERALAKSAIPYRMLGGVRFSDRKEIRDVVAYLQLIANHADRERLLRIINEPKRKIGERTIDAISQIAAELNCSMFEVIENASSYTALSRSVSTLEGFAELINRLTVKAAHQSLPDLFDAVLEESGYRAMLEAAGPEEKDRLDNLDEFKSAIIEYVNNNEQPTLTGFLEENALVADVDRYDDTADAVVLMTVHSAKGLEFPIVIIPGFEDGIFPSMQAITGVDDIEEERRLAYVALTRAKEKIYILHTKYRLLYGQTQHNPISRFATEIPEEHVKRESNDYGRGMYGSQAGTVKVYLKDGERDRASTYSNGMSRQKSISVGDNATVGKPLTVRKVQSSAGALKPGDRVRHMTFGEGEILSARSMGADILYEVMFDKVGTKKLMATYARLQKI
ncbi:MAG: UvrD-helicase domain-containing protein [Clostridia bacterium]|nr:UvrD-helicase domain-containing protein [Clostridia bacterium]